MKVINQNEIIYVDDSRNDRELVADCYARAALSNPLLTLDSGEALLGYLSEVSAGRKPTPAMILLDVNMPKMDGFEALSEVRRHAEYEQIPLIMLTSSDSLHDRERAVALGASDLRVKPFELKAYIQLLNSLGD